MSGWPFDPLPPLSYEVIMADPPWSFDGWSDAGNAKNAKAHYQCMSTPEICALPVGHLARGDCYLFLWATFPMMRDAFKVLDAWGFKYVTGGAWVKRGKSGKMSFGPGYVLRECAEPFLIGRVGNPRVASRSVRAIIEAPRRRHSEKPVLAYRTAETLFGPARRADLFSRRSRKGWESWGNEAGKLDGDPE